MPPEKGGIFRPMVFQISVCRHGPTANASRTASDEWLPRAARLRTAVQISVYRAPKPSLGGRGTAASAVVDEGSFLTFTASCWSFLLFFPHPSALRAATLPRGKVFNQCDKHQFTVPLCRLFSIWPDWMMGGLGSATSHGIGFFSSSFFMFFPPFQG